jgi:hypothetical protein
MFVALEIRRAMHMRLIISCDLPGPTVFSPHYLINGTIFEKKVTEHKKCVLIFSTFFRNISPYRKK